MRAGAVGELRPRRELLPDIVGPGLSILFVGAAPSLHAAASGHYYAGGRNRFWSLLHQSGLTPRLLRADEDRTVLSCGYGMTAVFPHLISTDNAALPVPAEADRERIARMVESLQPLVVCYNGKDVYRMVTGASDCPWGEQDERIGPVVQFVVHSSSGRADRWGADRLQLYCELRETVERLRTEVREHHHVAQP